MRLFRQIVVWSLLGALGAASPCVCDPPGPIPRRPTPHRRPGALRRGPERLAIARPAVGVEAAALRLRLWPDFACVMTVSNDPAAETSGPACDSIPRPRQEIPTGVPPRSPAT